MGARVLTADGQEVPIVMGSYGIGVERVIGAAVELQRRGGINWPASIALSRRGYAGQRRDQQLLAAAERLYEDLGRAGLGHYWTIVTSARASSSTMLI
jgi:prolyl-tRNA synthetase